MLREPGMSHTSMQLFLKQLVCCLLQPFCKAPEHQPWFNSGILLGSSLTLTPAGTACAGLKGKAGAEPGAAPAFHHTEPGRLQRLGRSTFPGQRGLSISLRVVLVLTRDSSSAAMGSTNPELLEAPQGSPGQIEGDSALLGGSVCTHRLNPAPALTQRGRRRAGQ